VENCGHVQLNNFGPAAPQGGNLQAEDCFWQAYPHCGPATLGASSFFVDAGETYSYTLQSQGSTCTLTDSHDHHMAPKGTSQIGTFTCQGMLRNPSAGGLIVEGCGRDGNIFLPPPAQASPTA
jgi:hypothetical protein